jgi:hypothetical protein
VISSPLSLPLENQFALNDLIRSKFSKQQDHNSSSQSFHRSPLQQTPHRLKAELLKSFKQYDTAQTGFVTPEALVPILDSSLHLKITTEEIRSALEKTQSAAVTAIAEGGSHVFDPSSQIDYANFISALDLREPDSIGTPFFDSRSNQIKRLKFRARQLNEPLPVTDAGIAKEEESPRAMESALPLLSPLTTLPSCDHSLSPTSTNLASPRNMINPSPIALLSPQKPSQPPRPVSSSVLKSPVRRVFLSSQENQTKNSPQSMSSSTPAADRSPRSSLSVRHPPLLSLAPSDHGSSSQTASCSTSRSLPTDSGDCDSYSTVQSEAYSPMVYSAREFTRPGVVSDAQRESLERAVSALSSSSFLSPPPPPLLRIAGSKDISGLSIISRTWRRAERWKISRRSSALLSPPYLSLTHLLLLLASPPPTPTPVSLSDDG